MTQSLKNNSLDSSKRYYPLIDIARFVAAFSVMLFHYFWITAKTSSTPIKYYLEHGYLGVQLFFMISGFVIFFSLQDNLKKFALSRFLRIYPLFWVLCTFTYIFTILFPIEGTLSFGTYLYNLLIINDGKTAFMIDGSYWTLTQELIFYTAIGLFVALFKKERVEWFFAIWLLLISVAVLCRWHEMFIFKIMLVRSGFYFIFGGVLALLIRDWNISSLYTRIRRILMMCIASGMTFYLSAVLFEKDPALITNKLGMYDKPASVAVLILFILMPILAVWSLYIKNRTCISISKLLGSLTYPLYLLHNKIGAVILGTIGVFGIFSGWSVMFIIILIGTCVIYSKI